MEGGGVREEGGEGGLLNLRFGRPGLLGLGVLVEHVKIFGF